MPLAGNRRLIDHGLRRSGYVATIIGLAALAALTLWPPRCAFAGGTDSPAMADEIAEMLAIKPGSTVVDIGAGHGEMAMRMAAKVGPTGRVFATEIDPARIEEIQKRSHDAGLANVTVIKATPTDSGLPVNCCDAAYMIGVYHHITEPGATDASIFRALKPGARLLINDFPPTVLLSLFKVKDVPADRGGHGVPDRIVIKEITAAGFREVKEIRPWHPGVFIRDKYCLVFSKPQDSATTVKQ